MLDAAHSLANDPEIRRVGEEFAMAEEEALELGEWGEWTLTEGSRHE